MLQHTQVCMWNVAAVNWYCGYMPHLVRRWDRRRLQSQKYKRRRTDSRGTLVEKRCKTQMASSNRKLNWTPNGQAHVVCMVSAGSCNVRGTTVYTDDRSGHDHWSSTCYRTGQATAGLSQQPFPAAAADSDHPLGTSDALRASLLTLSFNF